MARGGNETVRIGIQTVSEDAQAFDALNRKIKDLEKNLRDVKQTSREQSQEMKQNTDELDESFGLLGGTINSAFLGLAGAAGLIAGIGSEVIAQIQRIREAETSFRIDQTELLGATGDLSSPDRVRQFEETLRSVDRRSVRDENELLQSFDRIRGVLRDDNQFDLSRQVLESVNTGQSQFLGDAQRGDLTDFVTRSMAIDPTQDVDSLVSRGVGLTAGLGNNLGQFSSLVATANQAAAMDSNDPLGAFNAALAGGSALIRRGQTAEALSQGLRGITNAQEIIEVDGQEQFRSPEIAMAVRSGGVAGALEGLFTGQFSREQMKAAGIEDRAAIRFDAVTASDFAGQMSSVMNPMELAGLPQSLGSAAADLETANILRQNEINQRQQLAGGVGVGQRFDRLQAEYQAVNQGFYGIDLFGMSNLPAAAQVVGELVFDGGVGEGRRRDANIRPSATAARVRDNLATLTPSRASENLGTLAPGRALDRVGQNLSALNPSRDREQQQAPQRVEIDIKVSAPDGLNVQSEVN